MKKIQGIHHVKQQHAKKLTFVSVECDLISIELSIGDEIPLATIALMAFLPPALAAERSNVRLDVASMMIVVIIV